MKYIDTNFKKGEWYKLDVYGGITYAKIMQIDDRGVEGEYVFDSGNYHSYGRWPFENIVKSELANLCDFQWKLPEGHTDKKKSMRFKVGDTIRFKTDNFNIPDFTINVPGELIIHGNTRFAENKGYIVSIYENIYIVSFISDNGKTVQLGFKEDVLEPYFAISQTQAPSLVGRYIKALVDYPNGGVVKAGEYGRITFLYTNGGIAGTADFPSQSNYGFCRLDINTNLYELMPDGWTPTVEVAYATMPLEDLLAEAKKRYPKGTHFKCALGNISYPEDVGYAKDGWKVTSYYAMKEPRGIYSGRGCLFYKNKWADIIAPRYIASIDPYIYNGNTRQAGLQFATTVSYPVTNIIIEKPQKQLLIDLLQFKNDGKLDTSIKSVQSVTTNLKKPRKVIYF